ncbi:hypothetical protein Tco_1379255 [Tanacetum coccineum]
MVMEKDSKIIKNKKDKYKSIALKGKIESSDEDTSTSGSEDEDIAMVLLSDSDEDDAEPKKDEVCFMAQESNEVCLKARLESDEWIKDSGCSKHMTGNKNLFSSYQAYDRDNHAVGSENHPPMLNKDNYISWCSHFLSYAKSKPNGKLLVNSILHSPYMMNSLRNKKKKMEADDHAIQTILMGVLEDIYVGVDSCDTALEIESGCSECSSESGYSEYWESEWAYCCSEDYKLECESKWESSTSGTQIDKAPVYDSNRSAEAHQYENCYDNEIFNMFTQEEQYTELLEPIIEPHPVQQNNSNVISMESSMEHSGGTVEKHLVTVEEIRAYFESLYNNLVIEVEKVNTVNRKMKEAVNTNKP